VASREAAAEAERQRLRAEAEREKAARQAAAEAFAARVAAEEARARDEAARQKRILEAVKALEVPPALHGTEARRLRATAPEVAIPFSVTSAGPASQLSLEVRVNGRPVQPLELQVPGTLDGNARGVARVRVAEGESLVEIIARNAWGASEPLSFQVERALAAARPPAAQGDLYILAVGISEYARPDYRLDLAAKDAQDFAQAMRVQEARLYRRVHVRMLTNREATRAAIAREFEWLRNSVGPGDVAMLFMAGHGVNDSSGQYFFLPHDGQHDRLVGTAVSQAMIVGTLSRIRGKTVMFLDSCYAGNTLGALSRNGRQTEKLMNELSASENGVVVFASSTGQEESEERLDWGNGAFTKALLDGLGGRADFTRAGRVTFAALNLYLSEEVTRMTQGRQRPVFISPRGIPDFALARL
jgi:hypothetical protein